MSSQSVITVADRSVEAVIRATTALQKVSSDLNTLAGVSQTLTDDIQQKESQLANLNHQFDIDLRTARANLALQVLENEESTLKVLLAKRQLAYVSNDELVKMASELKTAQSDRAEDIAKATSAVTRDLNAKWGSEQATIKNTHAVETATLKAEAASLIDRNTFLSGEITSLRAQIDAERQTRLEVARAEAARQGVVVNTSSK